jgi:surfeit locus 1 family protein
MKASLRVTLAIGAALAGIAVTVSLGNWQLRRAEEKISNERAWSAAQASAPVNLRGASDFASVTGDLPHRVRVRGRFEHERTIWLDNRALAGRAGFFVVTPLRLQGTEVRLLVSRGWAPRDPAERTRLPAIGRPDGVVEIEGMAVHGTPRVLQFTDAHDGPIWQNLDVERLQRELGAPVAPFVLQQTSELDDGLDRHWAAPASGVDRHRGYAFQWFSLAALLAVITVGIAWRALRRRSVAESTA